jgi:HD-GYP domain-containing protein (c-di-GMP phosphodiesterase class II)
VSESIAPHSLRSAELARHKSARELGGSLVLAIHRLLRVAQIHAMGNMAVLQQLDQTSEALRIFCARAQGPATILFAKNTVFVSGQLLKASRTEYEAALDLGATLAAVGVSELVIRPDVEASDLRTFAERVVGALRDREQRALVAQPLARIRVRRVDAAALLSDGEDLPHEEQIVRAYAQAIVVMRRVVDNLAEGRFELPHDAKRIAQKLVMLSEGDTPSFLGVTAMRNANHDVAGRAVNASILAVAICRLLTEDLSLLSRIAMAALLHDVGRPLILGPERAQIPVRLSDEEEQRLPAAVAFVHTLLGGFRLPSMVRTVIDFEAHWYPRAAMLGPLHAGERSASLAARIVAAAHRFNALLTPDPAAPALLTPDEAVCVLESEARDAQDRHVVALLVGAIGLFPTGTAVELSSGELGVVVKSPSHPGEYVRPVVRIVIHPDGCALEPPRDLDLRKDPSRVVTRIVTEVDDRLHACRAEVLATVSKPNLPQQLRPASVTARSERDSEPPTPHTLEADARRGDREPPPKSREERRTQPISSGPPPTTRASTAAPATSRRLPWTSLLVEARRPSEPPNTERRTLRATQPLPSSRPPSAGPQSGQRGDSAPPTAPVSSTERPPSSISGIFSLITRNVAATARGTLGRTPLAHLLVYVLDRRLTGTLVLTAPEEMGIQHGIYFASGAPLRIWMPPGVTSLTKVLVMLGHLQASMLDDPLLSIVGEHEAALEAELVRQGWVSQSQVTEARELQLRQGMEFLFRLPARTEYAFFADTDLIEGHTGAIVGRVSPLELLVAGLRARGEDGTSQRVLERLGTAPIALAAGARADGYGFDLDESSAFEAIALSAPSLAQLMQNPLLDPDAARRVVYVLLLTRALALSGKGSERPPIENPVSTR